MINHFSFSLYEKSEKPIIKASYNKILTKRNNSIIKDINIFIATDCAICDNYTTIIYE